MGMGCALLTASYQEANNVYGHTSSHVKIIHVFIDFSRIPPSTFHAMLSASTDNHYLYAYFH